MNTKLMFAICKQTSDIATNHIDGIPLFRLGINYILNQQDPLDIEADIEGPVGTPYEGGAFRCILKLDAEFPTKPPKGYFLTKIFHPNVSEKGEICVNVLKKDWDPVNWSLRNILQIIRCLLIVPFPESSLNEEAGKLFMENYAEYAKQAKMITIIHAKPKTLAKCSENIIEVKMESKAEMMPFATHNANKPTVSSPENEKIIGVGITRTSDKKKWMKRL